ncbi:MAG TPA: dienelactone hydrolase family protein [Dermatophilaceae bacterium]
MCFASDQRPPEPPRSSEVGDHGSLVLTAGDGNRFSAYEAVPVTPRGASLVLMPDIRGMHAFYTDLALCFAMAGIDTVALDPYGRSAGLTPRDDSFEFKPHAAALTPPGVLADAHAAAARLHERSDDPVFTLGFCMFGGQSWRLAAMDLHPAGSIGFYGRPSAVEDVIGDISAPLLILAAGDDKATSPQENAAFVHSLSEAGAVYDFVVFEGAPHSFFDRGFEQWQAECTDAWGRMLGFIDRNR